MTRKVGISQAFRLAFPDENGGLPYSDGEYDREPVDVEHEVLSEKKPTGKKALAVYNKYEQETGQRHPDAPPVQKFPDDFAAQLEQVKTDATIKPDEANNRYDDFENEVSASSLNPDDKRDLIKVSIMYRSEAVETAEDANYVRGRVVGWKSVLGDDNCIALVNDLVEQVAGFGIELVTEGKKKVFVLRSGDEPDEDQPEETETESV